MSRYKGLYVSWILNLVVWYNVVDEGSLQTKLAKSVELAAVMLIHSIKKKLLLYLVHSMVV